MKRSVGRILTTHVGSLPRPSDLVALYRDDAADVTLLPRLKSAIADVVRQQADCGIDVVNDGEFAKAMRREVDFGAWWSYIYDRLAGFELREERAKQGRAAWTFGSKEPREFAEFYAEEASAAQSAATSQGTKAAGTSSARMYGLTCAGAVKYTGHAAIGRDIENLKAALGGARVEEAFMTAVSPATLQILPNEYYKSSEDYTWALAEAIRRAQSASGSSEGLRGGDRRRRQRLILRWSWLLIRFVPRIAPCVTPAQLASQTAVYVSRPSYRRFCFKTAACPERTRRTPPRTAYESDPAPSGVHAARRQRRGAHRRAIAWRSPRSRYSTRWRRVRRR